GANYDEFIVMKYLLCRLALDGAIKPTVIPEVSSANANSIVSTIKGITNMMTFLSTNYNANGVYTHTPKEEQYVIEDATFNATIDVEVLAKAFNMDKAQFSGQTKLVDSWGTHDTTRLTELFTNDDGSLAPRYKAFTEEELTLLDTIKAMIIDKDFLMCYDNFVNFTEQYNGQGLYWQYWYHTWKTFSASPFHNALLFTTEEGT
ncbi:phage major capsid protein, partial [Enterobacter hormaechei]